MYDRSKVKVSLVPKAFDDSNSDSLRQQFEDSVNSLPAQDRIWQGMKLEKQGKLNEAIAFYLKAIDLNPESIQAHQKLAKALKKQGKLTEAKLYSQRADNLPKLKSNSLADGEIVSPKEPEGDLLWLNRDLQPNKNLPLNDRATLTAKKNGVILPPVGDIELENQLDSPETRIAKAYLEQALSYIEERQWAKAIAACQKALEISPTLAEAHKVWGNCLQRLGKTSEAFGQYAKALEMNPDMAEVYANMGSLLARKKKFKQALGYFQQALSINPRSSAVYRNLAKLSEELGDRDKAEEYLFQAIDCEPKTLTAKQHFQLAGELNSEGKQQKAAACYRYAIELEPAFEEAYLKLIDILETAGDYQQASKYYRQVLALKSAEAKGESSDRPEGRIRRLLSPATKETTKVRAMLAGQDSGELRQLPPAEAINSQKSRIELEIDKYLHLAQQNPQSVEIQLKLGNLYAAKKQWQQGISCYERAIALNPNLAIAYRNLAQSYRQLGEYKSAAAMWYKAYMLEPEEVSAEEYFTLGNILLEQRQIAKANTCYRRAVQLKPGFTEAQEKLRELLTKYQQQGQNIAENLSLSSPSPTTVSNSVETATHSQNLYPHTLTQSKNYFELGKSAEQKNDWILANACYRKAMETNPQDWQASHHLGDILSKQKLWQQAVEAYSQAIAINPTHFWSHHNLGEAFLELKQWQDAANAYEQAIKLDPDFSWSHYKLGTALMELQQSERAADELRKSLKLKPDFDWAHHKLGDVLVALKDLDGAVAAYRRALAITRDLPQTAEKLNDALRQRYELDRQQVESFYQTAIAQEPERESLYYKTLEVRPDNIDAYINLAQMNVAKGNQDIAIAFYKIALQIEPDHQQVLTALEKLKS